MSLYETILWGAELFRQRPNFLIDLTEKFCQELATLCNIWYPTYRVWAILYDSLNTMVWSDKHIAVDAEL
jgi:hypothetical protein